MSQFNQHLTVTIKITRYVLNCWYIYSTMWCLYIFTPWLKTCNKTISSYDLCSHDGCDEENRIIIRLWCRIGKLHDAPKRIWPFIDRRSSAFNYFILSILVLLSMWWFVYYKLLYSLWCWNKLKINYSHLIELIGYIEYQTKII